MKIEIDTGSRLDKSGDTTFGFSNDIQKVLLLQQIARDECLQKINGRGLSRELRLFAACIYLLVRDKLAELTEMNIDEEYSKHSGDIKRHLVNLIKRYSPNVELNEENIKIKSIGKKSHAHEIAWQALRGKRKVDGVIKVKEVLDLLLR